MPDASRLPPPRVQRPPGAARPVAATASRPWQRRLDAGCRQRRRRRSHRRCPRARAGDWPYRNQDRQAPRQSPRAGGWERSCLKVLRRWEWCKGHGAVAALPGLPPPGCDSWPIAQPVLHTAFPPAATPLSPPLPTLRCCSTYFSWRSATGGLWTGACCGTRGSQVGRQLGWGMLWYTGQPGGQAAGLGHAVVHGAARWAAGLAPSQGQGGRDRTRRWGGARGSTPSVESRSGMG